jgi:hypothetical protein
VAKTQLRYVGNFVEVGFDDYPDAPSLVQLRGKRKPDHKVEVVAYLRSATALVVSPGIDRDIFDPAKFAGSRTVMTDGVYAWPKLLEYYVDSYDVLLPQEFEAHMQRQGWKVRGAIDKLALELPPE